MGRKTFIQLIKLNLPFLAVLALLTFAVYIKSIDNNFVSADDFAGYIDNPDIKTLDKAIKTANFDMGFVATMYQLFKLNPAPLHISSLVFHALVAFLIFIEGLLLFNKRIGTLGAVLFTIHPVNSEPVLWISGHPYLFNALFFFSSLIFFTLYLKSKDKVYLILSVAIYAFACAFVRNFWILNLLPVMLLINFTITKSLTIKQFVRAFAPFFIVTAIFVGVYVINAFQTRTAAYRFYYNLDPAQTAPLLNRAPVTLFRTFEFLVYPVGLNIYHEEILSQLFYISMIIFAILFIPLLIFVFKKDKIAGGLVACIFVTTFLAYNPLQLAWIFADRYLYLSSAFFCYLLVYLLIKLEKRFNSPNLVTNSMIIICILFAIRTFVRSFDWEDSRSLWLATQKLVPNSYRVYNNLGDVYSRDGNFPKAIESFEIAAKIYPGYAEAVHNIGNTYLQMGDLDTAEKYFLEAIKIRPNLFQSYYFVGLVEYQKKNYTKALEYFQKSAEIDPTYIPAQQALQTMQAQSN